MVRGAAGSFLTSCPTPNGQPFHLCGASTALRRSEKNRLASVSQPLACAGWKKPNTRNCLNAPRSKKLGPRRHGERDREAPRGAEHGRRAGRQAPQGMDLELPF